jgi:hypothetical protein
MSDFRRYKQVAFTLHLSFNPQLLKATRPGTKKGAAGDLTT